MAWDNAQVKDVVTSLRRDFTGLYDSARFRWDITHGRHGQASQTTSGVSIESLLQAAGYRVRVPVVSREVDYAANKVTSILGSPKYEVHVEPHRDSDKHKADKLEVIDSNLFLSLDENGIISYAIHRHQAVSPFAPVSVERNPYNLPKRKPKESASDYNDRVDRWRKDYRAFGLAVGDPTACAFLEDGNLNVTLAVREIEIPVLDLVKDYGEYDREGYAAGEDDPDLMFKLYQTQFQHVRAGYGYDEDRGGFYNRDKVHLCVLDDGQTIMAYVRLGTLDRDEKGKSVFGSRDYGQLDTYPNPFGRPAFFPIPGHFNPEAVKAEDRYTPILLPLMQSRWNMDMTWSQWASKAAERPVYVSPLDPQTITDLSDMDEDQRKQFVQGLASQQGDIRYIVGGKPEGLGAGPDEYTAKLYEEQKLEHAQYVPQAVFSGGESSQALVRGAPTSSLLRMNEIEDLDYDTPFRLKYDAFKKILECHDRFWMENQHGPNKPGQKTPEKMYATTTGAEQVQGRTVKRGQRLEMEPSDFDFPKTRSINRVDMRVSTIAANLDLMYKRMQAPNGNSYVTDEEVYTALGKTNVTEYSKTVRAERYAKRTEQARDALALAASLRRNALVLGINTEELLYRMGQQPAPQQPQGGGGGDGGPYQMAAPRRDGTSLGVSGV